MLQHRQFGESALPASGSNRSRADERALVVVGGGMAAHRLLRELAEAEGPRRFERIVVLAEEPRVAYDRVHLTDVLRGSAPDSLLLSRPDWYCASGIEFVGGDPVVEVDPRRRRIATRSGLRLRYDRLVLATGSAPVRPPIEGIELSGVNVYRTVEDAQAIAAAAERSRRAGRRVAVLGGGLLGVEVARALQGRGCTVDVFERSTRLLPRQLDAPASLALEAEVRALGLSLHLAAQVTRIEARGDELLIHEPGGSALAYGGVVVAAGVRPRDELARAAGITCHPRGGIEVDDYLATSAPGVYAIGECARHRGVVYGLAAPGFAMADLLARNLRGGAERFRGAAPATRLKVDSLDVSVAGDTESEGANVTRLRHVGERTHRCLVLRRGRVIGATSIGAWDAWSDVQAAIARGRRVLPAQRRRFEAAGSPWRTHGSSAIHRWPDSTTVCTCMGVDLGALRRAMEQGCADPAALAGRTGASTVCGTCEPLLRVLTGARESGARTGAGGGLLAGAVVALGGVALLLAFGPVPLAASVQSDALTAPLDALWRESANRQITGFVALALLAASLLFSLRKRLGWMRRISFSGWRSLHAFVGVGALASVALHTGLRLGSNLDRALMLSFLGVSALGGAAALAAALEHRLSPAGGPAVRRASLLAHVLIAWPLPVLLLFHVLKVYWY